MLGFFNVLIQVPKIIEPGCEFVVLDEGQYSVLC